jgi:sugar-specific transcriptional regulator TrmB
VAENRHPCGRLSAAVGKTVDPAPTIGGMARRRKDDPVDALRALGFTAGEALLYRTLVVRGSTGLEDLADRCDLTLSEAQETVRSLERRGLVGVSAVSPERWVAAPPGVTLRVLVNDRRHELEQAELSAAQLAGMHRIDEVENVHDLVEVVTGSHAVAQRFHQLQLGAVEEVCTFVTYQQAVVAADENEAEDVAVARGVQYRIVLEREALNREPQANVAEVLRRDQQLRVVDRVPTKLVIADRRTAMVPLETGPEGPAALIIHAPGLVGSLVALFDSVWHAAWPLALVPGDSDEFVESDRGPDEIDLQVLSLLLSGASDAMAAKQLDLGLRTVQRRVRALMDATGTTTRIQLGWAASERGWVRRP